jgi:serpin B
MSRFPQLPDLSNPALSRRAVLQGLALGVAGAVVASACGKAATTSIVADITRADVPADEAKRAAAAIDALATELYTRLSAIDDGNLVFSPYSIEIALAMTRNGAAGETRAQMDRVLHAGSGDELDRSLNALDRALASRNGHRKDDKRDGDVAVDVANALWGQKDFAFEQAFLNALGKSYGAGMNVVDYKADAKGAQKEINDWVSGRTHAKITDLIPDGVLNDLTRLVLTNAMYFKAPWLHAFGKVGDRPFRILDGSQVSVPTMIGGEGGTYGEGSGWQAAEVPYLGRELSMIVIVPDDLAAFERDLTGDKLPSITNDVKDQLDSIQMPLFTFRSKFALADHLVALGMPLPFADQADFSLMTKTAPVKIAAVLHQGFIAVDEEGTEAAAATAVVIEEVSGTMPAGEKLVVDKPFLFVIRDVPTGATLFLGRVTDPRAT